jgi:hypothetical protein
MGMDGVYRGNFEIVDICEICSIYLNMYFKTERQIIDTRTILCCISSIIKMGRGITCQTAHVLCTVYIKMLLHQ